MKVELGIPWWYFMVYTACLVAVTFIGTIVYAVISVTVP